MDELLKSYGEWAQNNESLIVYAVKEAIKLQTPQREELEKLLLAKPSLIPEERFW